MRKATEIAADPTIQAGDVVRPRTGSVEYVVVRADEFTGEVLAKGPNGKTKVLDAEKLVFVWPEIDADDPASHFLVLRYERVTCSRCGGKGDYPSSAWNGVCLGCNGTGRKLTSRGSKAMEAFHAKKDELMGRTAAEVKVGDKVEYLKLSGKLVWYRIDEIKARETGEVVMIIETKPHRTVWTLDPTSKAVVYDRKAQLAALVAACNTGGAHLEIKG